MVPMGKYLPAAQQVPRHVACGDNTASRTISAPDSWANRRQCVIGAKRVQRKGGVVWPSGRRTARITVMTAASEWAEALGEWAIPEAILSSAPESPWGFPVDLFVDHTRRVFDGGWAPTHSRVAEVMPEGGTLLDVGCGAGAASLPVVPPVGRVVGVDEDATMLDAMETLANGLVPVELVHGRWPDVANEAGEADVAVCANVLYNVADVGPFLEALTEAASERVVLELSAVHPQAPLSPLWRRFWGLARPDRPTADAAGAVVREVLSVVPGEQRWERPRSFLGERGQGSVAWVRRRLCLTSASDDDIAESLAQLPELAPAETVTLWWAGRRRGRDR
jgi:SAM-dependent methyltransferase